MNKKIWRLDNTEGYTQKRLDYFNQRYPQWLIEKGYTPDKVQNDEQLEKNLIDRFFNEVMIYG